MATDRKGSKSKKSGPAVAETAEASAPAATPSAAAPAAASAVQWRYAILCSPSAGGALVSRLLRATGLAGDPHAYFHPRALLSERARTGNKGLTLVEFMQKMERERTTPNGAFGLRIQFAHLMRAYGYRGGGTEGDAPFKAAAALLRRHDRLIWVRRRNKLHQAIIERLSRIARRKRGTEKPSQRLLIMPTAILTALRAIALEERAWMRMIRQNKLQVLEIFIEDLEKDYEGQCRRLLAHLGIADQVDKLPEMPQLNQNSGMRDQITTAMLNYLLGQEQAAAES